MVNATENYEIVELKYKEGIVTITDLIDAQSKKFTREGRAVTAIYDFLDDLANFDRQLSKFLMLAPEGEKRVWLEQVKTYLESRGVIK